MTTDREQHELAAKAAGLAITWKEGHCKGGPFEAAFIGDQPWRPKDDDGDAFRLFVDLQLQIRPNGYDTMVHARLPLHIGCAETHHDNKHSATRLAIFRVAVEIGRGLP